MMSKFNKKLVVCESCERKVESWVIVSDGNCIDCAVELRDNRFFEGAWIDEEDNASDDLLENVIELEAEVLEIFEGWENELVDESKINQGHDVVCVCLACEKKFSYFHYVDLCYECHTSTLPYNPDDLPF